MGRAHARIGSRSLRTNRRIGCGRAHRGPIRRRHGGARRGGRSLRGRAGRGGARRGGRNGCHPRPDRRRHSRRSDGAARRLHREGRRAAQRLRLQRFIVQGDGVATRVLGSAFPRPAAINVDVAVKQARDGSHRWWARGVRGASGAISDRRQRGAALQALGQRILPVTRTTVAMKGRIQACSKKRTSPCWSLARGTVRGSSAPRQPALWGRCVWGASR